MKKTLITCAADPREGDWFSVFKLAEKFFISYAERWGYEYRPLWYGDLDLKRWPRLDLGYEEWKRDPAGQAKATRDNRSGVRTSPMYLKGPMIAESLEKFDVVLFLDADVLILDAGADISLPEGKAFGMYHAHDATHPDWGPVSAVMLLKSCDVSRRFIQASWDSPSWCGCLWHDMCAIYDLLGYKYQFDPPLAWKDHDTEFTPFCHRFGEDWIGDGFGTPGVPRPENRFFHVSCGRSASWKLEVMQRIVKERGL